MKNRTFIYSIYDTKAKEYSQLLEFSSDEAAYRAIKWYIKNKPESPLAMSPNDFLLIKLGEFDVDAFIKGYVEPIPFEVNRIIDEVE